MPILEQGFLNRALTLDPCLGMPKVRNLIAQHALQFIVWGLTIVINMTVTNMAKGLISVFVVNNNVAF
jgi:hypothetical protein